MIFKRYFTTNLNKPKILVISGSTGSGKSRVAIELAKQIKGEIICADSIQIYKKLTIGSNSIDTINQNEVPFHLYGLLELNNLTFNVYNYFQLVNESIKDIVNRGKTPIIVGGCGFYLDSILKGSKEPLLTEKEREEISLLEKRIRDSDNWSYHYSFLKKLDPESASFISRNNHVRLAMSLYFNTIKGVKFSELKDQFNYSIKDDYDYRCFYLTTERLNRTINLNNRCDTMVYNGLVDEVHQLLKYYDQFQLTKPSKSLGYKETIKLLFNQYPNININNNNSNNKNNNKTNNNNSYNNNKTINRNSIEENSLINYIKDFRAVTRQYSKKQDTWFKKQDSFQWVDIKNDNLSQLLFDKFNDTFDSFNLNRNIEEEKRLKSPYPGFNPPDPDIDKNTDQFKKLLKRSNELRNDLLLTRSSLFDNIEFVSK